MEGRFRAILITGVLTSFFLLQAVAWSQSIPPTISHIPHQVIQINTTSGLIPFTVGDAETSADSLYISAVSKDTSLIRDSNLFLSGVGTDRYIMMIPTTDKFGNTSIIVTVNDGTDATKDTFTVKVNNPPRLDFNTQPVLNEGTTVTLLPGNLHAVDTDGPDDQITYVIGPDASGTATMYGTMMLDGAPLGLSDTFTQEDVTNNLVTYTHNGGETTHDMFVFAVRDGDGGIASDAGHTTFSFHIGITPVNDAPVTHDTAYSIGTGVNLYGTLKATDPDSPTPIFSIASTALLGTATVTDSLTGAFAYVPNVPGTMGVDSFTYMLYDGSLYASAPGKIIITILNQAPVATGGAASTLEGYPVDGQFAATDADLPPQPLTFSIVTNGTLGSASITDAATGTFTYAPLPGARGTDAIVFEVSDGLITSPTAVFYIKIRPKLHAGEILVASTSDSSIVLVDSANGMQSVYSSDGYIQAPRAVGVLPSGVVAVLDERQGLSIIDQFTGNQTLLVPRSAFTTSPLGPVSMSIEPSGNILIADGTAGIKRVNSITGDTTVLSSGDHIALALGVLSMTNGNIIATDASGLFGGQSQVLQIDPVTGAQSVISAGGNLLLPVGVAADDLGNIFISDASTFAGAPADRLMKVEAGTGIQTPIAVSETLRLPIGLAIDASGKLLVVNNGTNRVFRVDTASGAASILTMGGSLEDPFGITVVRQQPVFSSSVQSLQFHNVSQGSSKTDSVIITNSGAAPLYILSVFADSSQFSVTPSSGLLAPSESRTFYVTYTPASDDTVAGSIVFDHNAFHSPGMITVVGSGIVTGVAENHSLKPKQFALYANYPNPFNPTTTFSFDLPRRSFVSINVYSILGSKLATVVDHQSYDAGTYKQKFDASNYSSGIYFYELVAEPSDAGAPSFRTVRKMILLK